MNLFAFIGVLVAGSYIATTPLREDRKAEDLKRFRAKMKALYEKEDRLREARQRELLKMKKGPYR